MIVRDQFLLFDKFLVAPVLERDQSHRLVYLPSGDWYRFGKPETMIDGDQWLTIPVTLEDLPLFVRAGSIVVRNDVKRNTTDTFAAPETYDIYPDRDGHAEGYWFDDDGRSINDPNAQRIKLKWNKERSVMVRGPVVRGTSP